jgi:hypothetical protein
MNQKIVEAWALIKEAVAEIDVDVLKNAKGNASAGIRARKGLRALRNKLSELVKVTLEEGKATSEEE